MLREGLNEVLPDDLGQWMTEADRCRVEWKAAGVPMADRRPRLLAAINALYAPVPSADAGDHRS